MRAAFITNDLYPYRGRLIPGGCSYYRCMLPKNAAGPGSAFGRPAWTAEYGFGVIEDGNTASFGYDTVVLKLLMQRWVPEQIRMSQQLGQRVIVDVDDFHAGLHDDNKAKTLTDPDLNRVTNRDHYEDVILAADTITVSTQFLLDHYRSLHPDVVLVRNGIHPHQFQPRKHRSSRPVLGWIGQLEYRSGDMRELRTWLPDFLEDHDLSVHHSGTVAGGPSFAQQTGVNPERVTSEPMQTIMDYATMFNFDIGLVPLSSIDFNRAKSTIKGLEYSASNIPWIASSVGEYEILNRDLGVGRLASTPEQWASHATELLDLRTRRMEAAVNRSTVMQNCTITQRAYEWADVFKQSPATSIPSKKIGYRHV